jgi:hypothetical protein
MKNVLFLLIIGIFTVSCAAYRHDGQKNTTTFVMMGTNGDALTVTNQGVQMAGFNQVEGLRVVGQTTSTVTGILSAASVVRNKDNVTGDVDKTTVREGTRRVESDNATKIAIEKEKTAQKALEFME